MQALATFSGVAASGEPAGEARALRELLTLPGLRSTEIGDRELAPLLPALRAYRRAPALPFPAHGICENRPLAPPDPARRRPAAGVSARLGACLGWQKR